MAGKLLGNNFIVAALTTVATYRHGSMIHNAMVKLAFASAIFAMPYDAICGRTNTLLSVASDWTSPASYADSSFAPGAGDTVLLQSGGRWTVTYGSANWTQLIRLKRVIPLGRGSEILTIEVPGADTIADLDVPLSSYEYPNLDADFGSLVKTGPGTLRLLSLDCTFTNSGGIAYCAYQMPLIAEEGTLCVLPALQDTMRSHSVYCGSLTVGNHGVLVLPKHDDSANATAISIFHDGITGSGCVTNVASSSITVICQGGTAASPAVFSGSIGGKMTLQCSTEIGGEQYFTGIGGSAVSGHIYPYLGTIGMADFGGSSQNGSVNNAGYLWLSSPSGRFLYLGNDGSTDRQFVIGVSSATDSPPSIDAGEHGGLRLAGTIIHPAGLASRQILALGGSNLTNESVMAATLDADWADGSGNPLGFALMVSGGLWRFPERADSRMASAFAVTGGILRFDSIEEKWRICSLGIATNLTDLYTGPYNPSKASDNFITIGGGNADEPAVFEFGGNSSQTCSTRPIAIAGCGVFRNGSTNNATIRWRGVAAKAAGSTFVIDGGAASRTNEVADITGAMDVKKTGSGIWRISGDLSFTGGLTVEGGTLLVKRTEPGSYRWFRWTWRQIGPSGASSVEVEHFGLYDVDTKPRCNGLTVSANGTDPEPGECAWGSQYAHSPYNEGSDRKDLLDRMFNGQRSTYGFSANLYLPLETTAVTVKDSDPRTWQSVVVHLAEGAPEVKSWDFCNVWSGSRTRGVVSSVLEGSVDGLHWETVDEHGASDILAATSGTWKWSFNGDFDYNVTATAAHPSGRPLSKSASSRTYTTLANCTNVTVAAGASLVADGDGIEISGLTIDATNAGDIRGFSLAASGTLAVENLPRTTVAVELPGTYDLSGLANIHGWTLVMGGAETSSCSAVATNGKISIIPTGFRMIVR